MQPKLARAFSENQSYDSSSSFVEVIVAETGNVLLANPTSHVLTLNALDFVAALILFQRD